VTVSASPAKWNVLITDEGNGFDELDVPDPDDPESLLLEGGRGILMMRSYFSRTTHYRGGSALLMEKFERSGSNSDNSGSTA
jgi:anti-sigma regulatory factor (Ser/Thr protein kinase)